MSVRRLIKNEIKARLQLLTYMSNTFSVYTQLPVDIASYPCFVVRNSNLTPNVGNQTVISNNRIKRGYRFNIDLIINLDNNNTTTNNREQTLEELEDLTIDILQSKNTRDGINQWHDLILLEVTSPYDGEQAATLKNLQIITFVVQVDVIILIPQI